MANTPEIALIGGGTGSFTLLSELKGFTENISAVVNMSDDGGSSGRLRDELGILPPGDLRQCLVALSNDPDARDMFSHRMGGEGDMAGHAIGNIILGGLTEFYEGDLSKAIEKVSHLLDITGKVIPVTLDKHDLVMHDDGQETRGEFNIAHGPVRRGVSFSHDPETQLNPMAADAIMGADMVVIAPGNFYGSIIPALVTHGISQAFQETKAKKVMITNLVTKPGQTDRWHVVDYVIEAEEIVGHDQIDIVLYNNQVPSLDLIRRYGADGEYPIDYTQDRFLEIGARAIGASLVAGDITVPDANDKAVPRTLIRHDAHQVGRELMRLFYE